MVGVDVGGRLAFFFWLAGYRFVQYRLFLRLWLSLKFNIEVLAIDNDLCYIVDDVSYLDCILLAVDDVFEYFHNQCFLSLK